MAQSESGGRLISVVVPIYNAEDTLERCVRSVLGQTHPALDIVLVDDGATDGSGAMCDAFAAGDSRVRVIHRENGGLRAALLSGMAAAIGEFALFCDSDDWLCGDIAETLLGELLARDVDGVRCGFLRHENNTVNREGVKVSRVYARAEIEREILRPFFETTGEFVTSWSNSRCGKLYKTALLRRAIVGGNPTLMIGEDVDWNLRYLPLCGSVYVMADYYGYCYNNRQGSITHRYRTVLPEQYALYFGELRLLAKAQNRSGMAIAPMIAQMFCELFFSALHSGLPAKTIVGEVRRIRRYSPDEGPVRRSLPAMKWYAARSVECILGGHIGAGVRLYLLICRLAAAINRRPAAPQ